MTDLCYLATPYTRCPDLARAFCEAGRIAAHLTRSGLIVFSPIVHGHVLARASNSDPKDPALFERLNHAMCDLCNVLIIAHMEGWSQSDGIADELARFERAHKPIFDLDPRSLMMRSRHTGIAAELQLIHEINADQLASSLRAGP